VYASQVVALSTQDGGITLDGKSTDQGYGKADGNYADGWKWEFNFTVPSAETKFKMKFDDFANGANVIPASNIKIYSAQSSNAASESSALHISGAGTWSDVLQLTGDANTDSSDRQITVVVEVAIPEGSVGGNYTTGYDVESDAPPAPPSADTTPPVITLNDAASVNVPFLNLPYVDAGATAMDNVDGDITNKIVVGGLPIDTSTVGTHYVTYDVTDAAGNKATQVIRTVNVGSLPIFNQN
jgi:hypothetical protein